MNNFPERKSIKIYGNHTCPDLKQYFYRGVGSIISVPGSRDMPARTSPRQDLISIRSYRRNTGHYLDSAMTKYASSISK